MRDSGELLLEGLQLAHAKGGVEHQLLEDLGGHVATARGQERKACVLFARKKKGIERRSLFFDRHCRAADARAYDLHSAEERPQSTIYWFSMR